MRDPAAVERQREPTSAQCGFVRPHPRDDDPTTLRALPVDLRHAKRPCGTLRKLAEKRGLNVPAPSHVYLDVERFLVARVCQLVPVSCGAGLKLPSGWVTQPSDVRQTPVDDPPEADRDADRDGDRDCGAQHSHCALRTARSRCLRDVPESIKLNYGSEGPLRGTSMSRHPPSRRPRVWWVIERSHRWAFRSACY